MGANGREFYRPVFEGAEVREGGDRTAWWKKLFPSLVEPAWKLRCRLPDGRWLKSLCEGLVGSFHKAGCYAVQAGSVDVEEGGE